MKIAIVHPDLGIGGAEKLIIDVGTALTSKGHKISYFTSHYDPEHSFSETRDGTFVIYCIGGWLPRSIFGICYALCAYIRMLFLSLYIFIYYRSYFHAIYCDQISICIPILRASCRKVIFYCHFPDMLLTERKGFLKRIYRKPIDFFEEWSTGKADVVLVNSDFTKQVFLHTFPMLTHITPRKCYPCLNVNQYMPPSTVPSNLGIVFRKDSILFLSLNRFDCKKNISLAIRAFHLLSPEMLSTLSLSHDQWSRCGLVIAGGYDERVTENIRYYRELVRLRDTLGLDDKVFFLRSISSDVKMFLLANSFALLYTPEFEHFGIGPLEAMYMNLPVIAHNSGGPRETIISGKTGILCESGDVEFAQAMRELIFDNENTEKRYNFGSNGRLHVMENFSFEVFAFQLHKLL